MLAFPHLVSRRCLSPLQPFQHNTKQKHTANHNNNNKKNKNKNGKQTVYTCLPDKYNSTKLSFSFVKPAAMDDFQSSPDLPDLGPTPFDQVFAKHGVASDVHAAVLALNFADIRTFAMSSLSLEGFDKVIDAITQQVGRPLSIQEVASLRCVWTDCNASAPAASASSVRPAPWQQQPVLSNPSWTEVFPPKLSVETSKTLQLAFEKNYPSEILDQDSLPGPRLMALTHSQLQKKEWRFIPWRYRLSCSQHDMQQSSRPHKIQRLESLAVQDLIVDDVPTQELPQQIGAGAAQLTQILQLQATSIALCSGAHLHTLKKYVHKFVKVAMTRYEADTNLRGPTTKEMEAADKQIWCKIADLFNLREWSLDDAVNELTSVRSDIEALLQPRPNIKASMVRN